MRKVGLIAAAALVVALPLATLSASAQGPRGGVAARAAGQIGGGAGFGGGACVAAPSAPAHP